jgi:hypothetical protein
VVFDEELIAETMNAIAGLRLLAEQDIPPEPLLASRSYLCLRPDWLATRRLQRRCRPIWETETEVTTKIILQII